VNDDLTSWISEARWFGGKGRNWTLTSMRRVGELPDAPDGLRVAIQLAELTYDDGSTDLYQLPLAFYAEPQERISHALIGEWDDDEIVIKWENWRPPVWGVQSSDRGATTPQV